MTDAAAPSHAAIEAVWRVEAPRLIGGLVRLVGDLDRAEDLAQDALVSALQHWPTDGIPERPGAWLMRTAKNRAIDQLRQRRMLNDKHATLRADLQAQDDADPEAALDEDVGDDVLRLILIACHPVLPAEGRAALTLRLVCGLSTEEIARAFLARPTTIQQRIVRAKRTLSEAQVPFEVPRGEALRARLDSVLEVIYLVFNEGYAATAGDALIRHDLCADGLRLGRMLAALLPAEPEAHGLIALLELQASRTGARTDRHGKPVLLMDQDRTRWDRLLIERGLSSLKRAQSLQAPLGPYTLQAAIAACHARATRAADTDWARIVALYDALAQLTGSPVVELNRAMAVAMAYGPAQGLALADALTEALRDYHLLHAVRGDLLQKLGRHSEARTAFEEAGRRTDNTEERALLLRRARGEV